MCGRFALSAMLTDIAEEFSTQGVPEKTLPVDWNIKPTQDIYVIRAEDSVRNIGIVSWGMIAPWSKNVIEAQQSQSRSINARSESVHEKPTFRSSFRHHRCLIPASGYYEWATELGKHKTKQPYFITRDDKKLLAFAGIESKWISPQGVEIASAALLTRDAVGDLAKIHNRMPVMLPRDRWDAWLDNGMSEPTEIRSLFANYQADAHLVTWPVKTLVNSIRNNGPELVAPIEIGEPEVLF